MKKNKFSKSWLAKHKKDSFFKKSKIQGFRSRSSFKLIEMNNKFNFLKNKSLLLDLGSSPGGWSQVASAKVAKGKLLAVDVKNMKNVNNVHFINGDFYEREIYEKIFTYFGEKIDVILSDMAANTSGNKDLDAYRTGELCLKAMDLATKILKNNGVFISKLFMGSIFQEINEKAIKSFEKVIKYKPLSSKKESKEIYIFCKGILKIWYIVWKY